jgi:hypothetical protein
MKKRIKFCAVVRHAFQMVGRTWKSYALLSVTIVLSFSLLLGYLTFSDSTIYNEHKELFSYRRQDLQFLIRDADAEKVQLLVDNLSAMDDTAYYLIYYYYIGDPRSEYTLQIGEDGDGQLVKLSPEIQAAMLPDHSWPDRMPSFYYPGRRQEIVWLDGKDHKDFVLEKDEVIVTEALYRMLQMDQQQEPVFQLNLTYGPTITLRVMGYTKEYTCEMWEKERLEDAVYADINLFRLMLSNKFIDFAQLQNDEYYGEEYGLQFDPQLFFLYLQVYSDTPEAVVSLIETMGGIQYEFLYEQQNEALDAIRPQKQIKAIITCALLLILGINLYSCFTNALNDRKFEIGVKRAVGASAFSIVRQFLYESMIVMLANILLSISLVADVTIVYKYIVEHTPDETGAYPDFILYISPYSAAMFGICALSLTVVFSLIFAYKSTRVEIVQYLKAE